LNRKRTLSWILTTTCSWITQSKTCCFCCCWIEFYCKKLGARHKPLFFLSSLGFSFCVPLSLEKKNCFCFFAFFLFLSCMIDRHGSVWEIINKIWPWSQDSSRFLGCCKWISSGQELLARERKREKHWTSCNQAFGLRNSDLCLHDLPGRFVKYKIQCWVGDWFIQEQSETYLGT
jgi:hypothetical protein